MRWSCSGGGGDDEVEWESNEVGWGIGGVGWGMGGSEVLRREKMEQGGGECLVMEEHE